MKVVTYTSYKEQHDLYTEAHGSIAVNGCQIGLAQKRYHFTIKYLCNIIESWCTHQREKQ